MRAEDLAKNAAKVPGTPADAIFVTSDINFDTTPRDVPYTIRGFLNNPTFTFLGPKIHSLDDSAENMRIRFTGQISLLQGANSFVVEHDDGVVLRFADPAIGLLINEPGPTAAVDTPFTVQAPRTGLYDFTLDYGECCGGPAILIWRVNGVNPIGNPVPEPSSLALLTAGLLAVGVLMRKHLHADVS